MVTVNAKILKLSLFLIRTKNQVGVAGIDQTLRTVKVFVNNNANRSVTFFSCLNRLKLV
jgi:hypothetical protein